MSLDRIQLLTKAYADERSALAAVVTSMKLDLERVKAKYLPRVKEAVGRTKGAQTAVANAVDAHRELFRKPKSHVWHGIKVGLEKGKGKIQWEDPAKVVELIEKYLADRKDLLIKTTKKPLKKAIGQLSVADLKKIGCTVLEAGDQVVVAATDTEVDKLVAALLEEKSADEEDAAA